jgi:hypothetical protein
VRSGRELDGPRRDGAETQPAIGHAREPAQRCVHATDTGAPRSTEHRAAARIEVEFAQIERFLDAQPGAPEHDDQAAGAVAVEPVAAAAHHLDDLAPAYHRT